MNSGRSFRCIEKRKRYMKISSAGITMPGKVREENQDNLYINGRYKSDPADQVFGLRDTRQRDTYIFAVCDGIGGFRHGEKASLKAMEVLEKHGAEVFDAPEDYVERANLAICEEIARESGESVGTTLALLCLKGDEALFCNVGDSRIYLFREGDLKQISLDHTRARMMVDAGIVDADRARGMRESHIPSQHLGIRKEEFIIEAEIRRDVPVKSGDICVLCSDGINTMLEDEEIRSMLEEHKNDTAEDICRILVGKANDLGGRDNISAIVVKLEK